MKPGYKNYMAILCMWAREGPVYFGKVIELYIDDRLYIMTACISTNNINPLLPTLVIYKLWDDNT